VIFLIQGEKRTDEKGGKGSEKKKIFVAKGEKKKGDEGVKLLDVRERNGVNEEETRWKGTCAVAKKKKGARSYGRSI